MPPAHATALETAQSYPPPSDEVLLGIGHVSSGRHLHLVESEILEPYLSIEQQEVMELVSLGTSQGQIAEELGLLRGEVESIQQEAATQLGVENTTKPAAIHQAIVVGEIEVTLNPDEEVLSDITELDKHVLRFYALGGTPSEFLGEGGIDSRLFRKYDAKFLKKFGARTRQHAIRRGHELGILTH